MSNTFYTVYWKYGVSEIIKANGLDAERAFIQSYSVADRSAVAFISDGIDLEYYWDSIDREWTKKEVAKYNYFDTDLLSEKLLSKLFDTHYAVHVQLKNKDLVHLELQSQNHKQLGDLIFYRLFRQTPISTKFKEDFLFKTSDKLVAIEAFLNMLNPAKEKDISGYSGFEAIHASLPMTF